MTRDHLLLAVVYYPPQDYAIASCSCGRRVINRSFNADGKAETSVKGAVDEWEVHRYRCRLAHRAKVEKAVNA